MASLATSLTTALNRMVNNMVDDIAKMGLQALNKSLEEAGLRKLEHLKDYEVFSHVAKDLILFEIVLDIDAVDDSNSDTKQINGAEASAEILESEISKLVLRTYGLTQDGQVTRISGMKDSRQPANDARRPARDARRPARDARRPARDARRPAGKTASERATDHDIARQAPRSLAGIKGIRLTKEGKISLAFTRSTIPNDQGETKLPDGQFDGILGNFIDKLKSVISETFVPEFEHVLARYSK